MALTLDQSSLDVLSPHERNKICKQIRQQQIENYIRYTKEDRNKPTERKTNKKNSNVKFGINHQLQIAIEEFNDVEVKKLLKQGANANFITANNTTLLHKCCMVGNVTAAEILIGHGTDVNSLDSDWWTPLHVACYHDYTELVTLLLRNGADVKAIDIDGNFPFDHVTQDFDIYDVTVEYQERNGLTKRAQTDLRRSRCEILRAAIEESLQRGEDVNATFDGGITWLHMASSNGYKGVVKLLLEHQANVNAVDDIGWTPLHVAAKYSQGKAVKVLLKHGAECDRSDHYGRKPVEVAATPEIQQEILNARRRDNKRQEREAQEESDDDDSGIGLVSRNSHSSVMSKTDRLMESQMRLAAENSHAPRHHGKSEEEELEEEPIYISAIWKMGDAAEGSLPKTCDTDDLTTLPDLTEKTMVTTLKTRYENKLIYTYIGDILIAINPFTDLPYYAKSISKQYHECLHLHTLPPHIYAVADQARRHLLVGQTSQCCMISGESGAGKTESCKFLVQHLLRVSGSMESGLSSKINQVNPLLEAFGNAHTVMNDNSSRFAKFLEVSYTKDGGILGAELSEYLLEKSRVVHQGRGERSFHIFYWMLSGITPEEARSCLIDKESSFRYLESDGRSVRQQLKVEDKQKFWDVKNCLDFVGFAQEDLIGLITTLAAILHLGNVRFVPILDGQGCDVDNYDTLSKVAKLLRVEFEDLRLTLMEESMVARGEELRRPLSVNQSEDSRDALAKALYSRLFSWIVNTINSTIQPVNPSESNLSIAILDIFGFENLKDNGFEQICINLANEQLQMFFNERVFEMERKDCLEEGVPIIDVSYPGNQIVISLFLEKNTGIFALLDEESTLKTSTDRTLAAKLHEGPGHKYPSVYKTPRDKGPCFTIVHYAGSISYDLHGMLDKNRDTLRGSLSFVMRSSTSLLIKDLFQTGLSKTGSMQVSTRQLSLQREISFRRQVKSSRSPFDVFKKLKSPKLDRREARHMLTATGTTKKAPSTMAYHFRNSLNDMMNKLRKCQPHFVRCIKPNPTQTSLSYVLEFVQAQLLYTGVLETVKIRKHGYALRITCPNFLYRYCNLDLMINKPKSGLRNAEKACRDILHHFGILDYQMGKTKLFLHQVHVEVLDDRVLEIHRKIIKCQSTIRGFNARCTRKRLSSQIESDEMQISSLMLEAESKQDKLSDWLHDQYYEDANKMTTRLQREASKSLEALDEILDLYDTVSPRKCLSIDNTIEDSTTEDIFVPCPSGIDESQSLNPDTVSKTDDSGVEEGDDECYQDAVSVSGTHVTQNLADLPPPPTEMMDPSRNYPPSPRDLYGGLYPTIGENGHKVDKRHPPNVPQRAPDTRLSTFSPRSSAASSGIYNEVDAFDNGSHGQWQTPSSPSHHTSQGQGHWQTPSSPRLKNKFPQGQQQPNSPRKSENQPFSYGVNFSPKGQSQVQGQCNGNYHNGQRNRSGSTGSSNSSDNTYARWIHIDQEETDLPPYPDNQLYSPGYNPHSSYGVPTSPRSPGTRPVPVSPPVPPPNSCHTPPPQPSSQIQHVKQNATVSPNHNPIPVQHQQQRPMQQQKAPGSPKMTTKLHPPGSPKMATKLQSLKTGPQIPDLNSQHKSDPNSNQRSGDVKSNQRTDPVPPPPNFPAPPPPVSPQVRYQAVVQSNVRGRSPSPPPPPPPLDGSQKGGSNIPPPPPPISTIPNAKAARAKHEVSGQKRQNTPSPQTVSSGMEVQASQIAAEIGNIRLKRVNSPQAAVTAVAPVQTQPEPVAASGGNGNGQLNFRLRPTPGAVDIYQGGRDDTTKDEELPPPPPPPEPEPEAEPVAMVTPQPQEPKKILQNSKGNPKQKTQLPFNMDLQIPDDIDISNVPGVIPVTGDTPNWKRDMQEKKNREKIEEYVKRIMVQREQEAKWRDVPEWKRKILMKKTTEEQEAALAGMANEKQVEAAPSKKPQVFRPDVSDCGVPKTNANITPAAMGIDPEELESMPPWKRELLFKREKIPATFFNEFNPDEDENEAPPS